MTEPVPLVDSHCHLNYLEEPDRCLTEARRRGVGAFLCIAVDRPGIEDVLAVASAHADVWATAGQHPEAAAADAGWVAGHLSHPRVVAVGETGLDYYHETDREARTQQVDRFEHQLALADEHRLPLVVHTRAAEADTLARLRAHPNVTGVLHCFTESWALATAAMDLGYCISISGIVTFRNADAVRDVARRVPDDHLLVETDSPWLPPVPHRGKPNQPAYVVDTARFLADLRGVSLEDLARVTSANFHRLFGVGPGG